MRKDEEAGNASTCVIYGICRLLKDLMIFATTVYQARYYEIGKHSFSEEINDQTGFTALYFASLPMIVLSLLLLFSALSQTGVRYDVVHA
jgi:hypothetical protein